MFKDFNLIQRLLKNKETGSNILERNLGKAEIYLWGEILSRKEVSESFNLLEFILKNSDILTDNNFKNFVKKEGLLGILKELKKAYDVIKSPKDKVKIQMNKIKSQVESRPI